MQFAICGSDMQIFEGKGRFESHVHTERFFTEWEWSGRIREVRKLGSHSSQSSQLPTKKRSPTPRRTALLIIAYVFQNTGTVLFLLSCILLN